MTISLAIDTATSRTIVGIIDGDTVLFEEFHEGATEHGFAITELVAKALEIEGWVLSLGGGAILSEVTQELLRKSGSEIVFLDVSITGAAPRIGFNRDRPLLIDNPRARWVALMAARRHIYESLATRVVNTDDKSSNETVEAVRKELSK